MKDFFGGQRSAQAYGGSWGRCGSDPGGCQGLLPPLLKVRTLPSHSCGGALTPTIGMCEGMVYGDV